MLIDWFTVAAQLANFLILVWLLHRFLYKPILAAIDSREKRVAAELADVESKKLAAKSLVDELATKSRLFDAERCGLLEVAKTDAQALREKLVADNQKAAEVLKEQQAEGIISDNISVGQKVTQLVTAEVFAIVRKVLADLGSATLEASMVEVFIRRLQHLDASAHQILELALRKSADACVVSTRFDLLPKQESALQKALEDMFHIPIRLRFETGPASLGGIELNVGGQKLAWDIGEYLDSLEQQLALTLKAPPVVTARGVAPTPTTTPIPTPTPGGETVVVSASAVAA